VACDVLVVGGGSAGVAAAVAAARCGARTMLVERHGFLGGMATAALVHSICGLYLLQDAAGATYANPGFAAEFAMRLLHSGGASGPVRMGRLDVLLHQPTAFAALADQVVCEAGVELRLHSEVIAAWAEPEIRAVELCCRGARQLIEPRVVIDASGDAALAALAGAGFEQEESSRLQRPAFIFALQGVDPGVLDDQGRLLLAHRIASAVRSGTLPTGALGTALRATGRRGEAMVTIDLDGPPGARYEPTDPACLAALEVHGRRLAQLLAAFLAREVAGCASSYIAAFPARVGIRESRRVIGEYRIESDDVLRGARFADGVALATWPMEMREQATGARFRFSEHGRPYDIPLRTLRAREIGNLLVAGCCISASHEAQASLRVIGTCLATGEAAGLAAALLADTGGAATEPRAARAPGPGVIDGAGVRAARERVMLPCAERAAQAA
jgi:hypothetical protein